MGNPIGSGGLADELDVNGMLPFESAIIGVSLDWVARLHMGLITLPNGNEF